MKKKSFWNNILYVSIAFILIAATLAFVSTYTEQTERIKTAEARTLELQNQIEQSDGSTKIAKDYININTICKIYWPQDDIPYREHADETVYFLVVQIEGSNALYLKSTADHTLIPWFSGDGTLMTMRDLEPYLER